MISPKEIINLVGRFESNVEAYKSGRYNETQLRREFLDPFFRILGWDIDNQKGYSEVYKEVIHEDAIKIGGFTKAPDYCFRIGGNRKFFLEAKKPSVSIKEEGPPAFQLRRYAWSAKLPISILSDFEEFAVYDCRIKPLKTDKASTARILYLTFKDYIERWEEIASIFSYEAIPKGSFDKFVVSSKTKKGTANVDDAFLKEIEAWRASLANNIAVNHPEVSQSELNYLVQRTIDRIIFLRICEDRGIEDYGKLLSLKNGTNVYDRLLHLYRKADDRFNSGLFHFKNERDRNELPDELTFKIRIDDRVIKEIIKRIYYPDSPYEFSVLPSDILGQIYEQFLGKIINLSTNHQAVVEDKPEVKKAGGVYYTPTYIVDYIVRQTLGSACEGKKPDKISKLKIIDPACGSGSFLINAYQYLLDFHLEYYLQDNSENYDKGKSPRIYKSQSNQWRLTTQERKRILLNNIYGVDIDPQAVEVTKLSLLLKVLEGESNQTLQSQYLLFHERALPDLGKNIKCGNALIGSDFYEKDQAGFFDEDTRFRINVFNWEVEFSNICKAGGFDVVIGNPPYIFTREQISESERKYYRDKYKTSWEKTNTFMLFMEAMGNFLKGAGKGGFIVPNSWLTIESARLLRDSFIPKLELIYDLNFQVFEKVSMEPCIFVVSGAVKKSSIKIARTRSKEEFSKISFQELDRNQLKISNNRIVFSANSLESSVVEKVLKDSEMMGKYFDIRSGLQAYEEGKGCPPQTKQDVKNHIFDRTSEEDELTHRYLQGKDVGRYKIVWSDSWLKYGPWLSQPRGIEIFKRPRVLLREITSPYPSCLNASFTSCLYLNNKSILNILHNNDSSSELKFLLALLNSKVISFFYKQRAVKSTRNIFPKVVVRNLREFPFPINSDEKIKINLINAVDQMLDMNVKLMQQRTEHEKIVTHREMAELNNKIDQDVYRIFGLSNDECKIIEAFMI